MKRILITLIACLVLGHQAYAQNVPPGDDAGADATRFQREVELKQKALEKKKPEPPKIEIEEPKKKPAVKGLSFVLTDLKITGTTVFKPEDFKPLYQAYVGKKISFSDLNTIAEAIKAKYKEKGYLTTTTYIPQQDIVDGKAEIRVAEGEMGNLSVEGNKWFSSSLIERFIHLKKNEILNIFDLQRDLLRLNQNSDLEIKTILSPGAEPGTSDITLQIKDKFPYHLGLSVDNQGTRLVGNYRPAVSLRSTNLTGNNDSLFVNTMLSAGAFGESVLYSIPVTTHGTKVGFNFTYFYTKLGKEFKSYDIEGYTQIYTPYISQELYLSEDFQASVNVGLDIKSIKKYMRDSLTSNDQLRLPYFGFDFSKLDSFFGGGQTTFNPKFVFGTANFLGASTRDNSKASRSGTGGYFFKYKQYLNRVQKMPFDSYMLMGSQFQLADRTLPSSEQFQLGGANSVRGYPEGDYLSDIGFSFSFDWVLPMPLLPKEYKLPYSDTPLRDQIHPVLFMDIGAGRLMKTLPGERKSKVLMGLGGGLRINLYESIYVKVEWAGHVADNPTPGTGPSTFYLTVQSEI